MRRLIICEGKKFFHSRIHWILILFLLLFPLLDIAQTKRALQENKVVYDGEVISEQKGKQIADEMRRELQGTIDEAWVLRVGKQVEEYQNMKMDENDIRYQTIFNAYWDGYRSLEGRLMYEADAMLPSLVQSDLAENELQYGPYEGWRMRLDIFKHSAIVYVLICTLLFANMFNQEDAVGMVDLLHSASKGRKELALAKLVTALSITIGIGIGVFMMLSLATDLTFDVTNGDVSVCMMRSVQVFSFSQVYMQCFVLMMVGGMTTTLVCLCLSRWLKIPMISLLCGGLFFLLPLLFSIPISDITLNLQGFFPSNFLLFDAIGQIMMAPWISFTSSVTMHRASAITLVWLVLNSLLVIGIVVQIRNRKHCFLRRRKLI